MEGRGRAERVIAGTRGLGARRVHDQASTDPLVPSVGGAIDARRAVGLLGVVPLIAARPVELQRLEVTIFGLASLLIFLRNIDLLLRPELGPRVQVLTGGSLGRSGCS